jgi:hypothetical protein
MTTTTVLEWAALAFLVYAIVSYLRTPNPPLTPAEREAWLKRITEDKAPWWVSDGSLDDWIWWVSLPITLVIGIYIFFY